MPEDITTLPISELLDDRQASLTDIKYCELALLHGVKTYGKDASVQHRLDVNRKVVKMIDDELTRRDNTKQEDQCHTSQF